MAEKQAMTISDNKPYYIATYDNSYHDSSMMERVSKHQMQRQQNFITIEQPFDLTASVVAGNTYLIDCLSMWLFNHLDKSEEYLIAQLRNLFAIDCHLILVLNEVGCGVIPIDEESRRFVDLSGIIGQFVAGQSDEVYRVTLGLQQKLK